MSRVVETVGLPMGLPPPQLIKTIPQFNHWVPQLLPIVGYGIFVFESRKGTFIFQTTGQYIEE